MKLKSKVVMLAMLVMVNDASFQIAKNAEMLHSVC